MRNALTLLAALVPAACAHHRQEVREVEIHPPAEVLVERAAPQPAVDPRAAKTIVSAPAPMERPAAAYARLARYGKRTPPGGPMIDIFDGRDHVRYPDLLKWVAEQTGVRIRYDERNATLKSRVVSTFGPRTVAKDDLIAWLEDTCATASLVMVQTGPADRREYVVMDMAAPVLRTHARTVREDDLPELADRLGLYVSCVLTVPEGLDAARVRAALAQTSTIVAGLGRIVEIDGGAQQLVVTDFAPVVATMRRMLDEIAVNRWQAARMR